jgi:hypothetical protein
MLEAIAKQSLVILIDEFSHSELENYREQDFLCNHK